MQPATHPTQRPNDYYAAALASGPLNGRTETWADWNTRRPVDGRAKLKELRRTIEAGNRRFTATGTLDTHAAAAHYRTALELLEAVNGELEAAAELVGWPDAR